MPYYIRKILGLLITLLLVSLITFGVFQILPGDPVSVILGVDADPLRAEALTEQLGLNLPLSTRYLNWIDGLLRGSLGTSLRYQQPVAELISEAFSVTSTLAVFAICLTLLIGIPLGILLANYPKNPLSVLVASFSQILLSVPSFCTGILLISIFAVRLKWFPSIEYTPLSQGVFACVRSIFLPSLSIALGSGAVLIRYIVVSIQNQQKQDYVKTAKSKGVPSLQIMLRHVLRNSLIPVVTILGMLASDILGGSIIIENVFSLPGIGKLVSGAISTRDLPLIQGLVLYLAFIVVLCNFAVDLFYSLIDPRIRLK